MRCLSSTRNKLIMLLPTLIIYIVYIIAPIFIAIYYSFTKYSGIGKPKFIGLKNYERILSDPNFRIALKNTIILFVVAFILLLICSFLLALLLDSKLKGSTIAKSMIFSPAIIAPIIVGIIWWFIFDPQIGFLNSLLTQVGNENWRIMWIGDGTLAPYSIAFIYFWQQLGFITTIFFAGLRMIPYELFEAAAIDGASRFKKVWHITIPMLKETIQIVVVLIITGCFKVFEIVLQLTNGGPNHLSEVLVTYTYLTTFKAGQYGYGMSMAVVTFLIAIMLSISYILIPKSRKNAEGDM